MFDHNQGIFSLNWGIFFQFSKKGRGDLTSLPPSSYAPVQSKSELGSKVRKKSINKNSNAKSLKEAAHKSFLSWREYYSMNTRKEGKSKEHEPMVV